MRSEIRNVRYCFCILGDYEHRAGSDLCDRFEMVGGRSLGNNYFAVSQCCTYPGCPVPYIWPLQADLESLENKQRNLNNIIKIGLPLFCSTGLQPFQMSLYRAISMGLARPIWLDIPPMARWMFALLPMQAVSMASTTFRARILVPVMCLELKGIKAALLLSLESTRY